MTGDEAARRRHAFGALEAMLAGDQQVMRMHLRQGGRGTAETTIGMAVALVAGLPEGERRALVPLRALVTELGDAAKVAGEC